MPLILPGNVGSATAATGFNVDNSCRFDRASSDDFTKSSSGGSRRKATFSAWLKWGIHVGTSTEQGIFESHDGTNYFSVYTDGKNLRANNTGGTGDAIYSTQVLRDPSAWYHVVIAVDSDQGTASNRFRMYINGSEVTSFSAAVYPTENEDMKFNGSGTIQVGGGAAGNWDGYMAEVVWIDGSQLAPDQFGEFDSDSGIWKPIDVSGLTFGTNGFYLDFKDSANLGNDANGGTDLGENNIVANNQSIDTCTNNFCTMNPLYPDGTITFSEGNLKLTEGNSWRSAGGTMAVSTGKWFWEVSNVGNYAYIGFADIQLFNEGCSIRESFTTGAATTGRAHSVLNSDGRHYQVTSGGAQSSEYPSDATFPTFTNSIISIALNLDDNNFIFYKDGTAMNPSGNAISITAGTYIPAVSIYGNTVSYNFGSPSYSESGGNSDGNGYGNFSMAVPSGYFALNTKNLAEYG